MDEHVKRKRKISDPSDESEGKSRKISNLQCHRGDIVDKKKKSENDAGLSKGGIDALCLPVHDEHMKIIWKELRGENLNCDYCTLYDKKAADQLLQDCEETLTYNEGPLSRVKICGKWHDIPRKQVAHGDPGLSYNFSNTSVPARPWTPLLERIRDKITAVTGYTFNFVLVNRYKDGNDHIGEHRDDEKDLVSGHPIASLSLGQPRDFVFKHGDARGKNARRSIEPVVIELGHGGLLMMKYPTNTYWYHSLPQRKRLANVRINMTFRKMVVK